MRTALLAFLVLCGACGTEPTTRAQGAFVLANGKSQTFSCKDTFVYMPFDYEVDVDPVGAKVAQASTQTAGNDYGGTQTYAAADHSGNAEAALVAVQGWGGNVWTFTLDFQHQIMALELTSTSLHGQWTIPNICTHTEH